MAKVTEHPLNNKGNDLVGDEEIFVRVWANYCRFEVITYRAPSEAGAIQRVKVPSRQKPKPRS
jgi:hypothetical protein